MKIDFFGVLIFDPDFAKNVILVVLSAQYLTSQISKVSDCMALRTARNKSFELGSFSVLRGLDRAYWGPVNRFLEFVVGSRSKIEKSIF